MAAADKKIVLVTGASTGIGWETAKALLQSSRSYHILLGTQSLPDGEHALAELRKAVPESRSTAELLQVEMTSDDSIARAFDAVRSAHGRLDVLVNNAGISRDGQIAAGEMSLREAWNTTYDVNVTGAYILTHTCVPLLLASADARLLFVTSGISNMQSFSREWYAGTSPPSGWPMPGGVVLPNSYRASKTALNAMMLTWHWMLKDEGVKVWCVSPGFLATGLAGSKESMMDAGAGHASIGGRLITAVVEGARDADVGKVVNGQGVQPF